MMESVTEILKCPKCGGNFHMDYKYRTGEKHNFCVRCGFTQYAYIRTDANSHFCLEKAVWDIGEKPGNGVMLIKMENGASSILTVEDTTKERAIQLWNELCGEKGAEDGGYLTWFDSETGTLQCLYGEMPPLFDDAQTNDEEDY